MNTAGCITRRTLLAATGWGLTASWTRAADDALAGKPVRLIVPFPPGGGTDILARLIGQELNKSKGWTVVAENKAGAGGTLGIAEAVKAKADGHDWVMGQKDNLVVAPWLYKNVAYDPSRDLTAVAFVAESPVLIATRVESRFKTLADVVAAAQAAPNAVTYGTPGNGTSIHLATFLFEKAARVELRHVPYRGSSPALMDALAGNIDLLSSSVASAMAQVRAGKLRPLAVTSAKRIGALPEVPTVAESGYKGFDVSTWYGLFMPAGVPQAVVAQVNAEVNRVLGLPEVRAAIQAQGGEAGTMTPAQFAAFVKADHAKWRDIVRSSGVQLD